MRRFEGRNARDPYAVRRKLESPTLCPECHAVFEKGRWRWREEWPSDIHKEACPACCRARDRYPAGFVSLEGAFVRAHRREVLDIIRSEQQRESAEHPLNRVMSIEDRPGGLLVTSTDVHLPRLIGEAMRRSHKGQLRVTYDRHYYSIRVEWRRDEKEAEKAKQA
jgi:hypothetical protein